MSEKILLFIPCYNCQKQIGRVLNQLDSATMGYIDKVIVVNNRSTDMTEKVILDYIRLNPHISIDLLRNDQNYGLGGSHKVAINYAVQNCFNYIIVLHGDDQGDLHDILPILKDRRYRQYDCCLGARFQKGATLQGYSTFRTFGNHIYNMLFSLATGMRIYDLGSGLNIYDVKMFNKPFYIKYPDNLTFNYCMILAASYYHHKIQFFPISWREEDQVSNVKLVNQALKVLGLLGSFVFCKKALMASEMRITIRDEYTAKCIKPTGEQN